MSSIPINQLPRGWIEVPLGDTAELGAGGPAPQDEEHFSPDGHPFVRVQDLGRLGSQVWILETVDRINEKGIRASHLKSVPAGSVLFTKSGMSTLLNQRAILGSESYVVSHIGYATPKPGILSQWLYWALKRIDFGALAHATTLPSLKLSKVQEVRIPVAPAPEQRRIVAEIEKQFTRLEVGVGALKRVRANLKRYRAAVLKAACEGRLVPIEAELARAEGHPYEPASGLLQRILAERRARWETDQLAKFRASGKEPNDDKGKQKYVEPSEPEIAGLPELPEGWVWTTTCVLVIDGPQNGLYLPKSRYGEGSPILRIDDFQSGWSRSSTELEKVRVDERDASSYALSEGDLVINRVNSPTHLGKTLLVREMNLPAIFESNMMRLRLASLLSTSYVELYLRSPDGRARLIRRAKWAVNQASINQNDVLVTPIPLPPEPEQHRIVAEVERRLSVIDELEMQVEANLKRAERLRQAILKRAYEGKLVPQDPDDEPASVLLERIRAEREARRQLAGETKKGRQAKPAKFVAASEG